LVDYVDLNKSAYNQIDFSSKTNTPNSSTQPTVPNEGIPPKTIDFRLNPDAAATTIQSAYRGWRVREELSERDEIPRQNRDNFWNRLESAATKTTSPPVENRVRLAVRQREARKNEHEAAKKIQTAFKDYKTRRMEQNVSDSQKKIP